MTFDDVLFYLPGFASFLLVAAFGLAVWLAWRLFRRKRRGLPPPKDRVP